MSNTTSAIKSISSMDITRASAILLTMDSYMIVILYIIGMLGAILNIITFLQKQIRTNPCAVYFLSTSIVDFCIMNVFILLEILTRFNPSLFTLIYSTRFWCKIGTGIMFLLPCLSSCYITLASFDRFCVSSLNPILRKCSNLKVSRIMVSITFIVWMLFSLHIPIAFDWIRNPLTNITECNVVVGPVTVFLIIDGFFFSLFNGAIIPFLLCLFGLLICFNMKRSRGRVMPQPNTGSNRATANRVSTIRPIRNIHNRNTTHMLTMLLIQVLLTVLLNAPYIVIYLFRYFNSMVPDLLSYLLYIIFSFIARWFYYMNYCKTFYVNTLTSELFRKSLRQQLYFLFPRRPVV